MLKRAKISVIGAGNIGGECARSIAMKELGDVVLLDIANKDKPEGDFFHHCATNSVSHFLTKTRSPGTVGMGCKSPSSNPAITIRPPEVRLHV